VSAVGGDSRLNSTLIAVHDYSFFVNPPYESETEWANHISGMIGSYAGRTIATEWGGPMAPGSKNGVSYNTIDYSVPSGSVLRRLHPWRQQPAARARRGRRVLARAA
jgi:hypothetical protein